MGRARKARDKREKDYTGMNCRPRMPPAISCRQSADQTRQPSLNPRPVVLTTDIFATSVEILLFGCWIAGGRDDMKETKQYVQDIP
jgi:hypothetical protein